MELDQLARNDPGRVRFIDRALRSADCLVAEVDGRLLGYAVLQYTFFDQGFVSLLYVAQTARRQGIGTALMNACAFRCETSKLFTSTNQSNATMQKLLEALGYVPSGIIYNLDEGDPELVYVIDLSRRAS